MSYSDPESYVDLAHFDQVDFLTSVPTHFALNFNHLSQAANLGKKYTANGSIKIITDLSDLTQDVARGCPRLSPQW